ncbi:condensation domain-containing protein, partial [Paraburkholderia agricolaris]|uniref:condensation domain-containing protein n=1 Tax=Paraburkholderia agricolaris TaxID=2152888 RepID=UPI0038B87C00
GHGREDVFDGIDVSRTCGWFTTLFPVRLEPQGDTGEAICRVKETLRAIPARGLGFGALRQFGVEEDRAALSEIAASQVVFNYLGQFDSSFDNNASSGWQPASGSTGRPQDSSAEFAYALSINAKVFDSELTLAIGFNAARHDASTVESLLARFASELRELIAHCTSGAAAAGGVTPSDFPLAGLDQQQLRQLTLPVPATQIEDLYPLSPMQRGMLFHTLYAPNDSAYVMQLCVDIDGLDVARFRAAWQAVTERHDILRTGFVQQGDAWLQWVAKTIDLPFALHDLRDPHDAAGQDAALSALEHAERVRGFDLARAPLHRLTLVQRGDAAYRMIWTHHHVLLDGWSVSQLMGEVLRHYAGQALPANRGRYRDYVRWLQQRDSIASEHFWRAQLCDYDEPSRIAAALVRDAIDNETTRTRRYDELELELDAATSAKLAAFARQEHVTVNTLVQAAWALLLQRHTLQDTVVFGATVAGRPADLPDAGQLIGLFINTLPVIASPRAGLRVGDWLRAMQAQALASREHEHTPLNEIQRWAGSAGQALFDSLIVFENYPVDAALKQAASGGLSFGPLLNREETNYALTISVSQAETLRFKYSYDLTALSAGAVAELAERLSGLLRAFADDSSRSLGALTLLDDASSVHQQHAGCSTDSFADAAAVHELIERQAAATPDAIALVCGDEALSHAALN